MHKRYKSSLSPSTPRSNSHSIKMKSHEITYYDDADDDDDNDRMRNKLRKDDDDDATAVVWLWLVRLTFALSP